MLLAAGLAVRAWAMTTLGRHYTRTLRTAATSSRSSTGAHTDSCVTRATPAASSSGSATPSLSAAGSGPRSRPVLLVSVYIWRINAEEALLSRALGERYTEYQRRTKRLRPVRLLI